MNNTIKKLNSTFFILLGLTIPISVVATNILIGLIIFLWIAERKFREKLIEIKSSKWMISVLCLLILYCLGMLWGNEHSNAKGTFQILSLFLTFIIFETSKYSQTTLKWGTILFIFSTFISAILAILINQDIILPIYNYSSVLTVHTGNRPAFILYNYHNILLAFSSLICFFLFAEKKPKHRWLLIVCILIYCLSIFTEAGRAGQLILILICGAYIIYYSKKKIKYSIGIIIFLLTCFHVSYQYSYIFKQRVNFTINSVQNSFNQENLKSINKSDKEDVRIFFIRKSLDFIKKKPILGYGTGSFAKTFNLKLTEESPKLYTTPHNTYLYVWFEIGIFGLIILLSMFYFQIKSLYKLKYNFHRILLPIGFMIIMFFDSYLFSFILTIFYIYFFTIFNNYKIYKK